MDNKQVTISSSLYQKLVNLGIISSADIRGNNIGQSNYASHVIQPWAIWIDWNLNPWDADIIKRVLRSKGDTFKEQMTNRILDYNKIIHICKERLRQLEIADFISN